MVLFTGMIGFFVLVCVFYFCCDCVVYGLFWVFRGGLRKVYLSLMVCFVSFWFMRVDDSYSYLS
jgi:hypothetical protein